MELFSLNEMQRADALAMQSGILGLSLMEQAGNRVAYNIEQICEGPSRLCILAGPGNNGGDAFVVARLLSERAYKIDTFNVCLKAVHNSDKESDAKKMREKWVKEGAKLHSIEDWTTLKESIDSSALIIDGVFGAGLSRNIEGPLIEIIEFINQANTPVLAIDVPTGMNGNTGQIMGSALIADYTVSFHAPKQGHKLYPGKDLCGKLYIEDIGIPDRVTKTIAPKQYENTPDLWKACLKPRSSQSHKYNYGAVLVVVGDHTMRGASVLSSNAAIKAGAGLVTLALNKEEEGTVHPKSFAAIMHNVIPETSDEKGWDQLFAEKKITAALIGPGACPTEETRQKCLALLKQNSLVVIDAGALTAFQDHREALIESLSERSLAHPKVILTPHEGEFKKLFPALDLSDKVNAAREAAKETQSIVLIKGADTVIASPDGRVMINTNAPPTLATAGTGDVLAGIITALASNKDNPAFEAAAAGVYIHAECANQISLELVADDLVGQIPIAKKKVSEMGR
jgi:hydroxyethylthiazole kinase-like uncharacterized protein yjeF